MFSGCLSSILASGNIVTVSRTSPQVQRYSPGSKKVWLSLPMFSPLLLFFDCLAKAAIWHRHTVAHIRPHGQFLFNGNLNHQVLAPDRVPDGVAGRITRVNLLTTFVLPDPAQLDRNALNAPNQNTTSVSMRLT